MKFGEHRLSDVEDLRREAHNLREMELCGSFRDILMSASEGTGFKRAIIRRNSGILIASPHGGTIEPGSAEIAKLIAGHDFSLYAFESLDSDPLALRISSIRFDDPEFLRLADSSHTVLSVHGCGGDYAAVFVGGKNSQIKKELLAEFSSRKVLSEIDRVFPGTDSRNVCNRGTERSGVQLEISRGLRDLALADLSDPLVTSVVEAVRKVLLTCSE